MHWSNLDLPESHLMRNARCLQQWSAFESTKTCSETCEMPLQVWLGFNANLQPFSVPILKGQIRSNPFFYPHSPRKEPHFDHFEMAMDEKNKAMLWYQKMIGTSKGMVWIAWTAIWWFHRLSDVGWLNIVFWFSGVCTTRARNTGSVSWAQVLEEQFARVQDSGGFRPWWQQWSRNPSKVLSCVFFPWKKPLVFYKLPSVRHIRKLLMLCILFSVFVRFLLGVWKHKSSLVGI